jgi:hypothetical protein
LSRKDHRDYDAALGRLREQAEGMQNKEPKLKWQDAVAVVGIVLDIVVNTFSEYTPAVIACFALSTLLLLGSFYSHKNWGRWRYVPSLLVLIAFLGLSFRVYTMGVQRELSLPEGELIPANDPSPSHAICRNNPPDAVFVYFGSAAVSYAPPGFRDHTVVKIGGHSLLSLNRSAKGVTVSAKIFDSDGILVEIDHGKFKVYRGDFIKREHPDLHTLVVYDKWNNERIRVRYLNPSAISITGRFFYPGYASVVAKEAELQIGGNSFQGGSCLGGSVDADIAIQ